MLFSLLTVAAVQDVEAGKISNRLIVTGLMIGIVVQITEYQVWGVYYFLRNISVPVILLYLLFQMRVLGAGDIKLFSMIGSILTTGELFRCMAYSFLAAGATSVLFLAADPERRLKMRHAIGYLFHTLRTGEIKPYPFSHEPGRYPFAFSVSILFGTAAALQFPLSYWNGGVY